jgi:hypothetical protein
MKYCPKQAARRQTAGEARLAPAAVQSTPEPPVRRYIHPIRSNPAPRRDSLEEALAGMLETLSRQTDLLEELLRRTEKGDGGP